MVIDTLDIIVAYESYDVSPKSWDQVFTLKNETLQQSIGPANMRTSVDFKGSPLCGSKKSLKTTILNKGFNKEKTPNILVEFESLWLVWLTLSPPQDPHKSPPQDPHKSKTLGRGIYPNYPRGLFSGPSFSPPACSSTAGPLPSAWAQGNRKKKGCQQDQQDCIISHLL